MTRFASASPAGKASIVAAAAVLLLILWAALTMVGTLAGVGRLGSDVDFVAVSDSSMGESYATRRFVKAWKSSLTVRRRGIRSGASCGVWWSRGTSTPWGPWLRPCSDPQLQPGSSSSANDPAG